MNLKQNIKDFAQFMRLVFTMLDQAQTMFDRGDADGGYKRLEEALSVLANAETVLRRIDAEKPGALKAEIDKLIELRIGILAVQQMRLRTLTSVWGQVKARYERVVSSVTEFGASFVQGVKEAAQDALPKINIALTVGGIALAAGAVVLAVAWISTLFPPRRK